MIFTLRMSTFGETRSNVQLKRELYDRVQGSRESVREFSRALLEISQRLTDKAASKDNMLIDVFRCSVEGGISPILTSRIQL